jgi:HAD superfamily hydrolase (TIGR01549 family)
MIRAVLFDVGGPLDTEEAFEAALDADIRAGLEREGFVIDEAAWAVAHAWAVDTYAPSVYRAVIWWLTGRDLAASQRVYEWMESRGHERDLFELRDGIAGVLAALHGRGLKLGLAANQPVRSIEQLARHGIGHYFGNQGVSGVYGFRKPDIRLFLRACEDLQVQPDECIMVGDRIDNDVVPAKLLGMGTVRLLHGRHREQRPRSWDEMPDHEVSDAAGILTAIDAILAQDNP